MASKARHIALPDGYDHKLRKHAAFISELAFDSSISEEDHRELMEIAASLRNMAGWQERRNADR